MNGVEKRMRSFDAIVLGAGITGTSAALHLQGRGLRVLLVDRDAPGEDATRGNDGLLGRDGYSPVPVPLTLPGIVGSALTRRRGFGIDSRSLPDLSRFFAECRLAAQPAAVARAARALAPLQAVAAAEHLALARAASALRFFRRTGWIKLLRSPRACELAEIDRHFARILGVPYSDLDAVEIVRLEPHLRSLEEAAIYWPESQSVSSPGGVAKAYGRLFRERGGEVEIGDAATLLDTRQGYALRTVRGEVGAPIVVLALGAGVTPVLARFGLSMPLAACRTYHRHFRAVSGVSLTRPVTDQEGGFTLTPMDRGLRLVGGTELMSTARALSGVPVRANALHRAASIAKGLLPLGSAVEDLPVAGVRVFVPDQLPIVGEMPGMPGLWLSVGHMRDGFSLAPAMARLLADLVTDMLPLADPQPYSPSRFLVG